jgi:hypothetical protein
MNELLEELTDDEDFSQILNGFLHPFEVKFVDRFLFAFSINFPHKIQQPPPFCLQPHTPNIQN